jgi:hypothetical protein
VACSVLVFEVQVGSSNTACFELSITKENWAQLNKNLLLCLYKKCVKWTLNVEFLKRSGGTNIFVFL